MLEFYWIILALVFLLSISIGYLLLVLGPEYRRRGILNVKDYNKLTVQEQELINQQRKLEAEIDTRRILLEQRDEVISNLKRMYNRSIDCDYYYSSQQAKLQKREELRHNGYYYRKYIGSRDNLTEFTEMYPKSIPHIPTYADAKIVSSGVMKIILMPCNPTDKEIQSIESVEIDKKMLLEN